MAQTEESVDDRFFSLFLSDNDIEQEVYFFNLAAPKPPQPEDALMCNEILHEPPAKKMKTDDAKLEGTTTMCSRIECIKLIQSALLQTLVK